MPDLASSDQSLEKAPVSACQTLRDSWQFPSGRCWKEPKTVCFCSARKVFLFKEVVLHKRQQGSL